MNDPAKWTFSENAMLLSVKLADLHRGLEHQGQPLAGADENREAVGVRQDEFKGLHDSQPGLGQVHPLIGVTRENHHPQAGDTGIAGGSIVAKGEQVGRQQAVSL